MSLTEQQNFAQEHLKLSPTEFPETPLLAEFRFESVKPLEGLASLAAELRLNAPLPRSGIVFATPRFLVLAAKGGFLQEPFAFAVEYEKLAIWQPDGSGAMVGFVHQGQEVRVRVSAAGEEGGAQWSGLCLRVSLRQAGLCRGEPWPDLPHLALSARLSLLGNTLSRLAKTFPDNPEISGWSAFWLLGADHAPEALKLLKGGKRLSDFARLVLGLVLVRLHHFEAALSLAMTATREKETASWKALRQLAQVHLNRWTTDAARETKTPAEFWGSPVADFGFLASFPLDSIAALAFQLTPGFQNLLEAWSALEQHDATAAASFLESARNRSDWIPLEVCRLEAAILCERGDFLRAYELISGTSGFRPLFPLLKLALYLGREAAVVEFVESRQKELVHPLDWFWAMETFLGAGHRDSARRCLEALKSDSVRRQAVCGRTNWEALWEAEITAARDGSPPPALTASLPGILEGFERDQARRQTQEWCRATLFSDAAFPWAREVATTLADLFGFRREERLAKEAAMARASRDPGPESFGEEPDRHPFFCRFLEEAIRSSSASSQAWSRYEQLQLDSRLPVLVAVMGEFNAGKSTLINALLETTALPQGHLPTTPLPCTVRYGEQPLAVLVGTDFQRQYLPVEGLARVFKQSPASTGLPAPAAILQHIREIEIILPIPFLKNIWIIDTPGLNSGNSAHQQATEALVQRADAVLWVFDANQAGRASELNALEQLVPPHALKLIAVNRMDEIDRGEREEVLEHLSRNLQLPSGSLFPVSARQACENPDKVDHHGVARLRHHLLQQIGEESRGFKDRTICARALALLQDIEKTEVLRIAAWVTRPDQVKKTIIECLDGMQHQVKLWHDASQDKLGKSLQENLDSWQALPASWSAEEARNFSRDRAISLIASLQEESKPVFDALRKSCSRCDDLLTPLLEFQGFLFPPGAEAEVKTLALVIKTVLLRAGSSLDLNRVVLIPGDEGITAADLLSRFQLQRLKQISRHRPPLDFALQLWLTFFAALSSWHRRVVLQPLENALQQLQKPS